jgi:alkanesulfonate monooxygenase SsuD/methylene tetrahydromethanopterin reductase-like flavin-dependent oxidoreductase (luciferase family)
MARARLEPLSLLAALATVTSRVTLGTAALMPAYRQPVQAAQQLASLDLISAGRLVLAVGGGFPNFSEREFETAGIPWRTRFSRLDDTVALWRRLWSGERPDSFHGKVLHYDWLPEIPRPAQPGGPAVWLAGATERALARTGRHYDGWLPYSLTAEIFAAGLGALRATARESGRDPLAITPALFATVLIEDDPAVGRERLDAYCRAAYLTPLERIETVQLQASGSAELVSARLGEYVDAGAQHVLLRIGTVDRGEYLEQVHRFAELLLPRTERVRPAK